MWQMVVYNILQYVTRLKLSSLINILCHYLKKPVLSVASFYVCSVLGEKKMSPCVRGVLRLLEHSEWCSRNCECQAWAFSVLRKERPFLKQRSLFVQGVWRLPEYSEGCSRNYEHQAWAFGVRGKRESQFELEITFCLRCSETA